MFNTTHLALQEIGAVVFADVWMVARVKDGDFVVVVLFVYFGYVGHHLDRELVLLEVLR